MPGQVKYFLWKIEGNLVAFLFCLVSKDRFIDYYIGLDYSVAHKYHLFFIKFRDTLKWCLQHKIKTYEMGISGYEPKRRIGFGFVPLSLHVKLRNPILRPLFNYICQFLKFENFDADLKRVKKLMVEK
jgi:predicted N-acyltransferase